MDHFFQEFLQFLLQSSQPVIWIIFFGENIVIVFMVLLTGRLMQMRFAPYANAYNYTSKELVICIITVLLNTIVTYLGFWFWKKNIIEFQVIFNWFVLVDFILLFLSMDFLMYVFHFLVHKTPLHKAMHQLHHLSVEPKPMDLFVLHPVETLCFGTLWLALLMVYPFNFYSVIIYLSVNVIFGMIGHLGIEPLSINIRNNFLIQFLGTSTFHHQHHKDINYNFGFYTNIWDRVFGTLKK